MEYIFSIHKKNSDSLICQFNDDGFCEYINFLSIFFKIRKNGKLYIILDLNLKMTEDIKAKYESFFNENKNKIFFKIKSILDKIKLNEYFIILPKELKDSKEKICIQILLETLNYTEDNQERAKYFENKMKQYDKFDEIFENYDIKLFDKDMRIKIGESDKNKRVCRFCGKNSKGTNFRNKAHAISESLGFKNIISNEECDECNKKFGDSIEQDLLEWLKPFIPVFKIKGKKGHPEFKYQNGSMKYIEEKDIIAIWSKDNTFNQKTKEFNIKLDSYRKIKPVNIYKALVKYAIGTIENKKVLDKFNKTIKWINSDIKADKLPKIPYCITPIDMGIALKTYFRKNHDKSLPYMFCNLSFNCLQIFFIIPFSDDDSCNFTEDKEYNTFIDRIPFFKFHPENWIFQDFSSNSEVKINPSIKMQENK
ncbi:HNH endonuclease [Campylobacter ureolyticus]|uniref:HNH endonuclease n=1 Tax=Campylobacter ureolyticus TaxID=827 RepID=A0AAE7JPV6_9BACT|nr:HNH endonuclease [Campylobacter ureolyticus]MCR8684394.1 HNH endonuclease [Campylobacter ureolyticus]QKF84792.1 HNH endonuclease [Campylobacter ureolyticus]QQY35042.1 hypothetical protein I6I59_05785 [Campylobacter ureolyticus]SUX21158.1 Uncharacterised protein [Campylobacter ureolyticus]